jgi:hypothetical protein
MVQYTSACASHLPQQVCNCLQKRAQCHHLYGFQVPGGDKKGFPEGYRFSWIAFDPLEPGPRILFDCHAPKGPHLHVDGDPVGVPYQWISLAEAEKFFFAKVQERFGMFVKEELR